MMADFDINQLLQNPLFLGGVSGLLADPQDRAKALLGGIQTATGLQSAAQQRELTALKLAALRKQQEFNPMDYMQGSNGAPGDNVARALSGMAEQQPMPAVLSGLAMQPMQQPSAPQDIAPPPATGGGQLDLSGLLSGGLQAGYSPAEVGAMAGVLDPAMAARQKLAEPYTLGPGQVRMAGNQVLGANNNDPVNDPAAQLNRTMLAAQKARADGNLALADQLDALVQRQSGAFDQSMRQQNADAIQAQRDTNNAFRELALQNQQAQRQTQNDQRVQQQVTQFSNQVQKIGLPQAQTQLDVIQGIMDKYKGKELPGFNPVDSLLPTALVSQEGQQLRQAVASFANVLLKTRSGAAVTDPEQRRFMEELGTGKLMSSSRLRQGIQQMQSLLDSEKRNVAAGVSGDVLDAYANAGGDIDFSKFRSKNSARSVSIDNATPDDIAAELARRRGH